MIFMKKLFSYIRLSEWYDSKVPFMLTAFLFFYYVDIAQYGSWQFIIRFICYALYVSMFLAFSYVINDFSDIEVDKLAGKHKIISEMPKPIIILSMISMVSLGTIPLFFLIERKLLYILTTALIYFAGAAYSVHAFRFKEKGVLGLLECSIAQRCFPLCPLFFIIKVPIVYFLIFQLISFFNGIRYLLIHQNIDYENDLKSGVVTIATVGKINYRLLIKITLAVETALNIVLFVKLSNITWVSIVVGFLYVAFESTVAFVVLKYIKADLLGSFICVPYEDFYNIFLPIFLCVMLCVKSVNILICLAISSSLVFNSFKGKLTFIKILIDVKKERNEKNNPSEQ